MHSSVCVAVSHTWGSHSEQSELWPQDAASIKGRSFGGFLRLSVFAAMNGKCKDGTSSGRNNRLEARWKCSLHTRVFGLIGKFFRPIR